MQYDFSTSASREKTNAVKYVLREKLFKTKDVIPLWVSDMDIDIPVFILDALKKRLEHPIFGYEEIPKNAFLSQIDWMKKKHQFIFGLDDLFYSHSVVATMGLIIETFSEVGDNIVVQTPVYPAFLSTIKKYNRGVIKNSLKLDKNTYYTFDIEDLISKINSKTKLLFLCSPHNPVGRVWKRDELTQILDICLKHNILVFSDEIHSDLVYKPSKHIPFASLSKEARDITITAIGVCKTFNMAGFAMSSVVITNETLKAKFLKLYNCRHFAQGNSLGHVAFEVAYRYGDVWLVELIAHLKQNYEILKEVCNKYDDKIKLAEIEGTYLAWLDCRGMSMNNKALKNFFIYEAKLGLGSGLSFGKEANGFMRLNFAVSSQIMLEVRDRLLKALKVRYG